MASARRLLAFFAGALLVCVAVSDALIFCLLSGGAFVVSLPAVGGVPCIVRYLHSFDDEHAQRRLRRRPFDIQANPDGSSTFLFTHIGLTPQLVCYGKCNAGWNHFPERTLSAATARTLADIVEARLRPPIPVRTTSLAWKARS